MGRHAESPVLQHFIYSKDKNKSKCKYCVKEYEGKIITNLKRHIEHTHPDIHKSIVEEEEAAKKRKCVPSAEPDSSKKSKGSVSGTLDEYLMNQRVTIFMDKNTALEACLELVTKNGRPFSAVEDSGFQKLVGPIFNSLGMVMNRKKIAELVAEQALSKRNWLGNILKAKLISVKMDMATRLGRSFFGVTIQYPNNGKLTVNTLTVLEMTDRHTGENIKSELQKTLTKFDITMNRIYSFTTDNGTNFVKAVDLCLLDSDGDGGASELEEEESDVDPNSEVVEDLTEDDWEEEHEPEPNLETTSSDVDDQEFPELEDETSDGIYNIKPMRCAAHTLQLAVQDFLREKSVQKLVISCRKLAKKLRTTNMRYVLKSVGKNPPILDTETRWSSTYNTLKRLLDLKITCQELCQKDILTKTGLNEQAWTRMENLVKILEPAKETTDSLQRETLIAGELHEYWNKLKFSISALTSVNSKRFGKLLASREQSILSNPAVLAAMYVDPRYKNLLTPAQTLEMREEVLSVAKRLIQLSEDDVQLAPMNSPVLQIEVQASTSGTLTDEDQYEKLLQLADENREASEGLGIGTFEARMKLIKDELLAFETSPRHTDRKVDIFYWWSHKPGASQILKDAALTVLSLPVTQVSVERLFSGLRYILNDLKGNMNPQTVDDVMLLRTNNFSK